MEARRVFTVHGTRFELPTRYEMARARDQEHGQGAQGYGALGAVCEVWDNVRQEPVMVKKAQSIFSRPLVDAARFVRELSLLSSFSHPGVVQLLDAFPPTTRKDGSGRREIPLNPGDTLEEIYLVTRRYDATLLQVIRSKQTLEKRHVKVIAGQLLSALRYVHECGVAHTRLCPANILCDMDCTIAIGEFGSAEPCGKALKGQDPSLRRERDEIPLWPEKARSPWGGFDADERAEVWYKAPEVLLRAPRIGPEVDIWSAGLIIAELLNRRPLFPGSSYIEQLRLVTDACGIKQPDLPQFRSSPRLVDLEKSGDGPDTGRFLGEGPDAAEGRRFLLSMAPKGKVAVRSIVPAADKFVADILGKMLRLAPTERQSAQQLQLHPLFENKSAAGCDEIVIWRKGQWRNAPLGVEWSSMPIGPTGGSPAVPSHRVVLTGVEPHSLAEKCGMNRFIGYRLTRLIRFGSDGKEFSDKASDRVDLAWLDEGKGRLWQEEHPTADAAQKLVLRFGELEISPLPPAWAVPLHASSQPGLNGCIWENLHLFNESGTAVP